MVNTSKPHPPTAASEADLCAWLSTAAPGDIIEYHRGFLLLDTSPICSQLCRSDRSAAVQLAARALWAYEQGLAHLVQRRLGPNRFAYLAIMRRRPKDWTTRFFSFAEWTGAT